MSIYTRPVILLLSGLLLLTVCLAVLNTLVPLWLTYQQLPVWQVGLVGSAYFTGNLVGTLAAGRLIRRVGVNRSYYVAVLMFGAATAALALSPTIWNWLLWRFVAGVGCALVWVVVESSLMRSGTVYTRGRLLAAYMMVYYVGTVAGQLLIGKVSTAQVSVLPWATLVILASILPLLFTRFANDADAPQKAEPMWPMLMLRQARLGVNGCVISGVVLGSLYGLMPLYLNHQGISDAGVGFWMGVMVSAGIVGQWPVGWLTERFGRLAVLRGQVALVILGCVAMLSQAAMGPTLLMLGAAAFTLYPVAMAWACEKVAHNQLVAMNQALLLSYTIGSLLGPTLTAMLMESYSDSLLFIAIASVAMVYLMMLMRRAGQHPTPVPHA